MRLFFLERMMAKAKVPEIVKESPNLGEMLDSRFYRWFDLDDGNGFVERTHTILKAVIEKVHIPEANAKEEKTVLWFKDYPKALILNKTNIKTISNTMGGDSAKWKGQPVTLYVDQNVRLRGEKTCGIRVKCPKVKPEDKPVTKEQLTKVYNDTKEDGRWLKMGNLLQDGEALKPGEITVKRLKEIMEGAK